MTPEIELQLKNVRGHFDFSRNDDFRWEALVKVVGGEAHFYGKNLDELITRVLENKTGSTT